MISTHLPTALCTFLLTLAVQRRVRFAFRFLGIVGTTYLVARFTRATLDDHLGWLDVADVALLAGIGFTVSLLIGELAYGAQSLRDEYVKVGVLTGSLIAATLAGILLRPRNRTYRRIREVESADADADGHEKQG